jgi:hypothetical protein
VTGQQVNGYKAIRHLDWPFERVLIARNCIIYTDTDALVEKACWCFK